MNPSLLYLLLGFGIGSVSSLIGGVVSYIFFLRKQESNPRGALGCIFFITGALVLIGFITLIFSIPSGTLGLAIITGVGVFIGFAVAFGALLRFWTMMQPDSQETNS